jgi:hypothetical protein
VVDLDATIGEHALKVAVADRELQVPAHRPKDDLAGERMPRKAQASVMNGALG